MELRALYREDDAVSSVLGVVLMVAVTIVLAAVIGTFVLGIGSDLTDSSPNAQWEFSENLDGNGTSGSVVVLHGGGDDVKKSTLEVTVGGTTVFEDGSDASGNGYNVNDNWGDPITTGDRLRIEENTAQLSQGQAVRIIWSSGDSSAILADEQLG
ncbi:hypothetical protein L593_12850 [Salinarchaeum sp. Harcht-Bsk1]|uniref:type IV pilin n=1 Tax=Salinarchaeum sp. Harcht-Bsk1 TaxID=1333523 RepID=UPI00034246F5|nr:type IV pilin N-terminal domain-containing protein [Salinarchaeum sp. Harcht-Bsk1]AGN02509.1 hypothetical protein L593_12850 [Salinarchaeum sp. Harcht-Bsk1]